MKKIPVYNENMTMKEQRDLAYWERNMLALYLAKQLNNWADEHAVDRYVCGWYTHGEWMGWSRVVSIDDGRITFHVPDGFDLGDLPEIEPNWNGHSTEEKWKYVMAEVGIKEQS